MYWEGRGGGRVVVCFCVPFHIYINDLSLKVYDLFVKAAAIPITTTKNGFKLIFKSQQFKDNVFSN